MKSLRNPLGSMQASLVWVSLLCTANLGLAAVSPVVVFDSFGPGNSYLTSVAWGISGASTTAGYRGQAEWFIPSVSGNLSSFTLATYRQSGTGRSNFFIAEDNGFDTPGLTLESFLGRTITANGLFTLSSSTAPLLQAGTKYWLCQEPTDAFTQNGWFENGQSYRPGFAYERSPSGWSFIEGQYAPPSGVFRVSVVPIPEPTLLGFVIPAWWLLRRARQTQP